MEQSQLLQNNSYRPNTGCCLFLSPDSYFRCFYLPNKLPIISRGIDWKHCPAATGILDSNLYFPWINQSLSVSLSHAHTHTPNCQWSGHPLTLGMFVLWALTSTVWITVARAHWNCFCKMGLSRSLVTHYQHILSSKEDWKPRGADFTPICSLEPWV